jgi:hypothetical protein
MQDNKIIFGYCCPEEIIFVSAAIIEITPQTALGWWSS